MPTLATKVQTKKNALIIAIEEKNKETHAFVHIKTKIIRKNEYVYLPHRSSDTIYVIQKGRVKVGKHQEGPRAIIKNVLQDGDFFGELSLLGQASNRDFALAMEDTTLYCLSNNDLALLIKQQPSLISFLLQVLGARLIDMERRLESVVFRSSRSRIIDFLQNQVHKRGERVGYEMLVRGFFTHQEIAYLTATSRQTVTAVLNELRSKNILVFNRRRLLIRNMEMLIAEAA